MSVIRHSEDVATSANAMATVPTITNPAGAVETCGDAWSAAALQALLRDPSPLADDRWRRWCAELLRTDRLGPQELLEWWRAAAEFDPILAEYGGRLIPVPERTVVVAGSGKEQFKTFNISTAAAILAAATGVSVVKGVSRSVSAVSGASDILDVLGIKPVLNPEAIPQSLERHGIAFVSYPQFCPRYAARYDGVFATLNPASFFMPIAALGVEACGYLFGLAHSDVTLAAATLRQIRPDLTSGVVVSTELTVGETVDEYADVGVARLARLTDGVITGGLRRGAKSTSSWRRAVAHRPTHGGNAALVVEALTAHADTPATRLVEMNAALVLSVSNVGQGLNDATNQVRCARRAGRAESLLASLITAR
ncbi:hypothetical protein ACQP2E_37855 [Actinoplanes sp. CA-015351]|uniref:hypothetical protein n=1 Tax=Actinoplanes sp. CA-015351 TaxID=3239897 RepID=UPI003D9923B0